jgi:uncharacterized damage-inducible protein DinB
VTSKTPWIQRRFTFDMPVTMFPNVLERLRGAPARVEDRVHGLRSEDLRIREGESWSVQEIIGHLIEVEALWLGRLDDFEAGLQTLRAADMENRRTFAAYYNDKELREILQGFRRVRGLFVRRLELLDDAALQRTAHHPRLDQPMRVLDLMMFAAEHDDHHLARITELLEGAAEKQEGA